jgi:GDP-4-dehydro-6-deoxy-D-mannose reductase
MGAMKVINAAQEAGCKGILQVSSAEVYGDAGETLRLKLEKMGMSPSAQNEVGKQIDENMPIVPHSSYGASKAAIDAYCQVTWKERGTKVIALRQFNCCGTHDGFHPYVIPAIWRQLVDLDRDNPATIHLGNNTSRDFLDADDAVAIAVELLEKGSWGEVYNLGSETSIKVYDLAMMIGRLMGFKSVEVKEDESRKRPWDIWHLQSANDKIYSVVDRRPQVPMEESVGKTITWLTNNRRMVKW